MTFLKSHRPATLDLPLETRRSLWLKPFLQSYGCVFVCYAAMYLIRKNYNVAQNDLISTYGLTMTQLGVIGLAFSITYGIGKTVVSYYSDGKNTKQFLPLMVILSALAMLVFSASLGSSGFCVALMAGCYGLSGFFQSCGGPCSYATVTKWTPRRRRGSYLAGWNVSHNLGGALAASVALFGANVCFDGHVIGMFVVPAVVALVIGLIGWHVGNDSPEAYGLGTVEELFNEPVRTEDQAVTTLGLTKWQTFHRYLLTNPVVWLICLANIFVYLLRIGVDQWATIYSYQVLGLPKNVAIQGFVLFEIGAIFGTLSLGFLSDWAKGRRALLSCLSLVIIAVALRAYQTATNPVMYLSSMAVLGCLVFGVQLLLGVAIVSMVPKIASSAADGLKGTTAYLLGDSMAKIGLGMIADGKPLLGLTGWEGTFTVLYASILICLVLLAMVALVEEKS